MKPKLYVNEIRQGQFTLKVYAPRPLTRQELNAAYITFRNSCKGKRVPTTGTYETRVFLEDYDL